MYKTKFGNVTPLRQESADYKKTDLPSERSFEKKPEKKEDIIKDIQSDSSESEETKDD